VRGNASTPVNQAAPEGRQTAGWVRGLPAEALGDKLRHRPVRARSPRHGASADDGPESMRRTCDAGVGHRGEGRKARVWDWRWRGGCGVGWETTVGVR
jgi:hypothetical protein